MVPLVIVASIVAQTTESPVNIFVPVGGAVAIAAGVSYVIWRYIRGALNTQAELIDSQDRRQKEADARCQDQIAYLEGREQTSQRRIAILIATLQEHQIKVPDVIWEESPRRPT